MRPLETFTASLTLKGGVEPTPDPNVKGKTGEEDPNDGPNESGDEGDNTVQVDKLILRLPSSKTLEIEETKNWGEFMDIVKKLHSDTFNEDEQTMRFEFKGK